jgi:molybdate transport system permease protein
VERVKKRGEAAGEPAQGGRLAVVAGDTLSSGPAATQPQPWTPQPQPAPAPRSTPHVEAPFGFVPLAVIAVAFLVLPLVALVARAPWRSLPSDLAAPGVLTALRL